MSGKLSFLAMALMLPSVPGIARAESIFACYAVNPADCNGNLYSVSLSQQGSTYILEYAIKVTDAYPGDLTDRVQAVGIKEFAPSPTDVTLIAAPDGPANWQLFLNEEMNAGGCSHNSNPPDALCAEAKTLYGGAPLDYVGNILSWQFKFDFSGPLSSTAHIKYLYVDANGNKVGSLSSFGNPISTAPEPATGLLIGGGMVLLAVFIRRRMK